MCACQVCQVVKNVLFHQCLVSFIFINNYLDAVTVLVNAYIIIVVNLRVILLLLISDA